MSNPRNPAAARAARHPRPADQPSRWCRTVRRLPGRGPPGQPSQHQPTMPDAHSIWALNIRAGGTLFCRRGGTAARPMPPPSKRGQQHGQGHGQAVVPLAFRAQGLGHDHDHRGVGQHLPHPAEQNLGSGFNQLHEPAPSVRRPAVTPSCHRPARWIPARVSDLRPPALQQTQDRQRH